MRLLFLAIPAEGYIRSLLPLGEAARAAFDAFDESAEELWAHYGLPAPKWVGLSEETYLDVCPPSLQAPHVRSLSRVLRIRATEAPDPAPQPSRPMIYVTFGTVFGDRSLFETVLAGLQELDVEVIATVGRGIDPADLGHQPDHVRVERFIPQREVLGRASLVICHAGSGTLRGALAAGVPVLMLPQGADQYWNADACAATGGGTVVDLDDLSAQAVTAAARSVLDARYSERAQMLADEIAAMPSPECLRAIVAGTAG